MDDLQNGLFTYHLVRGLKGKADHDRDGRVGVSELFEFVAQEVTEGARKFGRQQIPWRWMSGTGGVYVSEPRTHTKDKLETIWRKDGCEAAVCLVEKRLTQGDVPTRVALLRFLREKADPAALPAIFRCLPVAEAAVHQQARQALHAVGWDKAAAAIKAAARRGDAEAMRVYLDGFAAFEARRDFVNILWGSLPSIGIK